MIAPIPGQTTLASVAYTLDAVGNRTGRVDEQGTHSYQYDSLYRLTSVTYPGPSTTTYTFDRFGNRTSMTNGAGTTTYAYDDADRLAEVQPPSPAPAIGYDWDGNGNLVERGSDTFAWDYEDRMVSATVNSVTTTFTYRGDGLRDSRTTGLATTTFTWDINAGLPVVLDDGNRYLYGAGLESMLTATASYYYLADGLGSTMAMVDSAGTVQKSYTYDIYGKPTATGALANEYDFAAQQTDPTGLQYLRARYMDPETGTFISRELLEATPGWTGNPFGYAGANPARMVDPTGLVLDDGGDGCGKGACQDLNDLIPHAKGTFFREYGDQTQFCRANHWPETPGGVTCAGLEDKDFETKVSCTVEWGAGLVSCFNQFGGMLAALSLSQPDALVVDLERNAQIIAALIAILAPYHDSFGGSSPEESQRVRDTICRELGLECPIE